MKRVLKYVDLILIMECSARKERLNLVDNKLVAVSLETAILQFARHGRALTGESPEYA